MGRSTTIRSLGLAAPQGLAAASELIQETKGVVRNVDVCDSIEESVPTVTAEAQDPVSADLLEPSSSYPHKQKMGGASAWGGTWKYLTGAIYGSSTPESKRETHDRSKPVQVYACGLRNQANSCYFNSVVQAMAAIPELKEYLEQIHVSTSSSKDLSQPKSVSRGTLALCSELTRHKVEKKKRLTPHGLYKLLCEKEVQFQGNEQQDADECFRLLMKHITAEHEATAARKPTSLVSATSALHDTHVVYMAELHTWQAGRPASDRLRQHSMKPVNQGQSPGAQFADQPHNPFNGRSANIRVCGVCKHSRATVQDMSMMSLRIPQHDVDGTTIEDCLIHTILPEKTSGVNCPTCTHRLKERLRQIKGPAVTVGESARTTAGRGVGPNADVELERDVDVEAVAKELFGEGSSVNVAHTGDGLVAQTDHWSVDERVLQPPQSLCISLNRNQLVQSSYGHVFVDKVRTHIEFEEFLDLRPYMTQIGEDFTSKRRTAKAAKHANQGDTTTSAPASGHSSHCGGDSEGSAVTTSVKDINNASTTPCSATSSHLTTPIATPSTLGSMSQTQTTTMSNSTTATMRESGSGAGAGAAESSAPMQTSSTSATGKKSKKKKKKKSKNTNTTAEHNAAPVASEESSQGGKHRTPTSTGVDTYRSTPPPPAEDVHSPPVPTDVSRCETTAKTNAVTDTETTDTAVKPQESTVTPTASTSTVTSTAKEPVWYRLESVVVHSGMGTNRGHYVTFRRAQAESGIRSPTAVKERDAQAKDWLLFNDEAVHPCTFSDVQGANHSYLLFYTRWPHQEPQSHGVAAL
eukprot:GFYU01003624.1.p1 GENE.GFYU01003624.1~~GFYU01003624.1.p1  ORF type:complete len:806 (+),score=137.38 GFYU01003624.1:182-2599(+)